MYVALFHYMDLCGCFWLERGSIDIAAFWNGMDCKYLGNSSVYNNGCRCRSTQKINILTVENGSHINCEGKPETATLKINGKKTYLLHHSNHYLTFPQKLQAFFITVPIIYVWYKVMGHRNAFSKGKFQAWLWFGSNPVSVNYKLTDKTFYEVQFHTTLLLIGKS